MFCILSLHSSNVKRQSCLAIELLAFLWVWQSHLLLQSLNLIWVFFFFLFTRLCPSLSPLYTLFIITIIYYYHLYFVEFNPWKRQNELCNHLVEGDLSSIKFTIDLASHTLHSLLGTMFTFSVLVVSQSYRHVSPSDKLLKDYRRFISNHLKEIDDSYAISKAVQLKVQGHWTRWFNYIQQNFLWKLLLAMLVNLPSFLHIINLWHFSFSKQLRYFIKIYH